MTLDPSTLAAIGSLSGTLIVLAGGLGSILARSAYDADIEQTTDWALTWWSLPADVQAWVADQYRAVDLPPPALPARPSPIEAERR